MALASMTGFARTDGADERVRWAWEARSVNGKSLDLRLRIPSGWERLDPIVRKEVGKALGRGNVTLSLEVRALKGRLPVRVNEDLLADLADRCRAAGEEPRLDRLMTVRGVVETAEDEEDLTQDATRIGAITDSLAAVLDALAAARAEEGSRIEAVLRQHLAEIEHLVVQAKDSAECQPAAIRDRLTAQIGELLADDRALPEERLAQEAAALAAKADVREELDRLIAHVEQARGLLDAGGPCGRRLDFLCQEFNREANTLCSKASALAMTRIGLDLKSAVDQLREQVQNLE